MMYLTDFRDKLITKASECKQCSDNRDHDWGLCECPCHVKYCSKCINKH